jgi:serine/threonine protein kinase, bacterial
LTGQTPFSGDSALSIAYQRLDSDVPPPGTVIDGVPGQFDELVVRATARDPAERYADAHDMGIELAAIVDELALSEFRVPAPRNSAQHRSTTLYHSQNDSHRAADQERPTAGRASVRHATRQLTRGPQDWATEPDELTDPEYQQEYQNEYPVVSGQFAGIEMSEFALARQHARRMVLIWVAVVLAVTGMAATAAWTIGSNLSGLL